VIPYTVDRRADTGVTNVTLGIWLFLASEVMLFGALFSSYALLRIAAPEWPAGRDVLSVVHGGINTVLLLAASALVWRGRTRSPASSRGALLAASAVAALFLAAKAWEYSGEIRQGLLPSTSTFLAMYFTLTGFHAAHVVGGAVANLWVLAGSRRVHERLTSERLHALSLYWAFVDLVWLVIFSLMYLS
jgi:heme/copper-type cytochrome/quinol oxidase subunit 3